MEILAFWFIGSIIVGIAAGARGRSGLGWFLLSAILSPVLMLVLVLVLPNRSEPVAATDPSGEVVSAKTHVRCPDCRELVRADARKCKHCGTALIPQKL